MAAQAWQWLLQHSSWAELPGYVGALFVVTSFMMKTMIPLRVLTILSNVCFIIYALLTGDYPTVFLHALLLPLNAFRLGQMLLLMRRARLATTGVQTLGALKPFMRRGHFRSGQVVFQKGQPADNLYYLVSGQFRVLEAGTTLGPGEFVGELGLLAPDRLRTNTVECVTAAEVLAISYEHVIELYYENPDFGYHLLRVSGSRLFGNIEVLQRKVALLTEELAAIRSKAAPDAG